MRPLSLNIRSGQNSASGNKSNLIEIETPVMYGVSSREDFRANFTLTPSDRGGKTDTEIPTNFKEGKQLKYKVSKSSINADIDKLLIKDKSENLLLISNVAKPDAAANKST